MFFIFFLYYLSKSFSFCQLWCDMPKDLLVHFKSSIALNDYLLPKKHCHRVMIIAKATHPRVFACFGWLRIETDLFILLFRNYFVSFSYHSLSFFFSPNKVARLRCIIVLTPFHIITFVPLFLIYYEFESIFHYTMIWGRSKRPTPVETIKRKTR